MVSMANKLSTEKRARSSVAWSRASIRATVRMTGAAKNTVAKLLVDLARRVPTTRTACCANLACERIECDEIWSFCYSKQKNVPEDQGTFGYGDVWTWTAIDADTKLVPTWHVGQRTRRRPRFIATLASRLANRVQLTTDGRSYLHAVDGRVRGRHRLRECS